jgi:hypothetical protein
MLATSPLFIWTLPLLLFAAALLLAQAVFPAFRHQATIAVLATGLVSFCGYYLLIYRSVEYAGYAMLAALLAALPLLDRARFHGLWIGASLAGIATIELYNHASLHLPLLDHPVWLPAAVLLGSLAGLAGGMKLPLHPLRLSSEAKIRTYPLPQSGVLLGWILLAGAFLNVTQDMPENFVSPLAGAVSAALATLLLTRRMANCLQKTGEALAAGALLACLCPVPMAAAALGLLACCFVLRAEAIAQALRIDDPLHMIGALLLPSLLAMLIPGLFDLPQLARALQWEGAAILIGLAAALILWPLVMAVFGLALPERLLREGTNPR